MKQTRTTLKELTAMYRAVLRHGILCNAIALGLIATATPAMAAEVSDYAGFKTALSNDTNIVLSGDVSGDTGASVPAKSVSVDLGGHTLTIDGATTAPSNSTFIVNGTSGDSSLNISNGSMILSNNSAQKGAFQISSRNGHSSTLNANLTKLEITGNTGTGMAGGIYHENVGSGESTITANEVKIANNTAEKNNGAAILNISGKLSVLGETNTFSGNKRILEGEDSTKLYKRGGGAIANASGEDIHDAVLIVGTETSTNTFTGNTSSTNGGAIMNRAVDTDDNAYLTINGTTTFENNTAALSGGAIYNIARDDQAPGHVAKIDLTNGTYTFTGNTANNGGAIYNAGTLALNGGTFTGNTATSNGGAVWNSGTLTVTGSVFGDELDATKGNKSTDAGGGAIYNQGILSVENSEFYNNQAKWFGAIRDKKEGTSVTITNSTFGHNSAEETGAVGIFSKNGVSTISGSTFDSNSATATGNDVDGTGALFVGSEATLTITDTIFKNNTSAQQAGAIGTRNWNDNDKAKLDIIKSTFTDNTAATLGGAINNFLSNSTTNAGFVTVDASTFTSNSAANGGAIYNHKAGDTHQSSSDAIVDGKMKISGSTFTDNTATTNGGAVYNAGALALAGTNTFTGNTATERGGALFNYGELTVENSVFTNNTTTGESYPSQGGAIYNAGDVDYLDEYGKLTVNSTTFGDANDSTKGNVAMQGGAISNDSGNGYNAELTLNNTNFYYNKAQSVADGGYSALGGAIHNVSNADVTVTGDTIFKGNSAVGYAAEGGAIYNSSWEKFTFNNAVTFDANTVEDTNGANGGHGGAVSNVDGTMIFKDYATFTGNKAVGDGQPMGGALHNESTVDIQNGALFSDNEAMYGGALSNFAPFGSAKLTITDGTFTENKAGDEGGAIFNLGEMTFAGTNTFSGNTANGVANDIYNAGTLTFAAGSATEMDGGIAGTGALTIANGATLNIGRATISQKSIMLDGTLIVDVVEGGDYILGATNSFDGNGTLSLAIEKAGTYKLFNDKVFARAQEQITSTVYELDWSTDGGKTVIATTKSADKIASETGIEKESAAVVSNIAQSGSTSDSSSLREMAIKMQQALAAKDTMLVEHAAAALHPEKEVVKQSVTSSVQNTVMNLAATRMIAAAMGRNGGDVDLTATGVWAQGLYNKTKMNGHFDGHTLGIAAGVDGTINNDFTVGLGYAFNHSEVSPVSRDIDIDSHTVFVYGQYKPSDWYVNAVLNYTFANYDESGIALGTPVSASYDANAFGGQVVTGYNFAGGITPEFGLRYLHINGSDYTNNIGIKNELKSADYLTAILGTRYGFNIAVNEDMAFRPELRYAIKYDMISDKSSAIVAMPGIASYTMNGDRLSRVGAELGIGVTMSYQELNVSLNYDIDIREDYTSQTGMLKLRYEF